MVIIIPCYNEYAKLDKAAFTHFLENTENVSIVFSEDGSTDRTLESLREIRAKFASKVHIYLSKENHGKAEAIRSAVIYIYNSRLKFTKIAYIDADLSVSLEECMSIAKSISKPVLFAFGSRISKIDNTIIRTNFRHFSGRFVATITSNLLGIPVYDTQCGCKVFDATMARDLFAEAFISRWLFDVEIFFRIIKRYSREEVKEISSEIPLHSWIDFGSSKVKLSYFFKMWHDFYLIKKQYRGT